MIGNKVFCRTCRSDVEYSLESELMFGKIGYQSYKYRGEKAICGICGKQVCVEEVQDRNYKSLHNVEPPKREIEYRGKSLASGEWVYGYLVEIDNELAICPSSIEWLDGSELRNWDWRFVDPKTVGQYTGLKDKNGTKIYEGDIIKIFGIGCNYGYSQQIVSVSWDAEKMCFMCGKSKSLYNCSTISWAKIEVIGNIHDNPELLGVE